MTLQSMFDSVKNHLLTQNETSRTEGGDGAYRGKNGLRCAVGVLIPDELYHQEMEGAPIQTVVKKSPELAGIFEEVEGGLVLAGRLQELHDLYPPQEWRSRLKVIAKNWRLT